MVRTRLIVDYNEKTYTLKLPAKTTHGVSSECGTRNYQLQDLTTMLLAECKFGFTIQEDEPVYVLCFSSQAREALDESVIEVLKRSVEYHNRFIKRG